MTEIRAKVTKEFDGVEDGKVYPRLIGVGEEIVGSLAETAIGEKWAKETRESKLERGAAEEDAERVLREQKELEEAAAALKAKREEDVARLALLPHAQLVAIAAEHQIDIAGLASEEAVIEAIQRGLEALELEIPAPVAPVADPAIDPQA